MNIRLPTDFFNYLILINVLRLEALQVFCLEVLDVCRMTENFLLCHANIYVGTLGKHLWCLSSIVEAEERHYDVASHILETASQEVVNCLIVSFLHLVDGSLVKIYELSHALLQCLQII